MNKKKSGRPIIEGSKRQIMMSDEEFAKVKSLLKEIRLTSKNKKHD